MRLSVHYTTAYHYSEPPRRIVQLLRVTPVNFGGQTVLDWRVHVDCDARLRKVRDGYGNVTHMLYVDRPVDSLTVAAEGLVLTDEKSGLVEGLAHDLPPPVFLRATELTRTGGAIERLAETTARSAGGTLDRLHALAADLHGAMRFDTEATGVHTTAEQAFGAGHGVCQDFAHVFIAVSRRLGIPARYVSGHLFRRDGQLVQEAGHAWAEAWIEDLGWTAFDPVNGICTDDAYIRVACGLDYRDAAPVSGARSGGGDEELKVEVRVSEAARQAQAQSQS